MGPEGDERKNVACEEVREEESGGSPGVLRAPGVGANTAAALADAARGPGTRPREIESRKGDHI